MTVHVGILVMDGGGRRKEERGEYVYVLPVAINQGGGGGRKEMAKQKNENYY